MGQAIIAVASEFPDVSLHACVARSLASGNGPAGSTWMTPDDLLKGIRDLPQDIVAIDVSLPDGTTRLLDILERRPVALVSATTGVGEGEEARIRALSVQVPVLRAPNLSPGNSIVAAMLHSIPAAAKELFEIDVIEHHHAGKLDAPSGTALAWTAMLGPKRTTSSSSGGPRHPRPKGEICVHSIRSGAVAGTHRALFAGAGETVEVVHTVYDRAVFARGALRAVRFLRGRAPGLYSVEDSVLNS